jgi:predicted metalloprotease with PDZ domain
LSHFVHLPEIVFMKHFLLLLFTLSRTVSLSAPSVTYAISFPEPHTHYIEVQMLIEGFREKELAVKMPVWAPGSYLVREFARNVEGFKASSPAGALKAVKKDKNTWSVTPAGEGPVTVSYRVYANELSVRTSFVNEQHGYINGTSVFMYVNGLKHLPLKVKVKPFREWKVISTGLKSGQDKWELLADNYDVLADSPIEIGNHRVFDFTASGTLHHVAMFGEGNYNEDSLKKDMAKIAVSCTSIFGENPNKEYTFIVHNITVPSGGLEHLNSTTLQVNRWTYSPRKNYLQFLSLVAHEYFHLWNVKRLRPVQLGPFDYDRENYTELLWLMEGVTSYYDEHILRRCAFVNEKDFLETFADGISVIENQPGNTVQSVAEASFDAWIKHYRPNENSHNSTISYYSKGQVLGGILDLELLNATGGEKGLDALLRYLYDNYYKNGNKGITETDVEKAANLVAGRSMDHFFRDYINGTNTIDYSRILGYAGLEIRNVNPDSGKASLGAALYEKEGKLLVKNVTKGSAAYIGGLNAEDEIIAANGYRMNNEKLTRLLAGMKPGEKLTVTVSRDDIMRTLEITLNRNTNNRYRISKKENPDPVQEKIYNKWLFAGK